MLQPPILQQPLHEQPSRQQRAPQQNTLSKPKTIFPMGTGAINPLDLDMSSKIVGVAIMLGSLLAVFYLWLLTRRGYRNARTRRPRPSVYHDTPTTYGTPGSELYETLDIELPDLSPKYQSTKFETVWHQNPFIVLSLMEDGSLVN